MPSVECTDMKPGPGELPGPEGHGRGQLQAPSPSPAQLWVPEPRMEPLPVTWPQGPSVSRLRTLS